MTDILLALPILLSGTVPHECAHGIAERRMRDDTGYLLGRVPPHPRDHLDPFMSLLVPLLFVPSVIALLFAPAGCLGITPSAGMAPLGLGSAWIILPRGL
jgi:hypothetical protein